MGRILSLDIGLKRTGIAITDENRIIVTPLEGTETALLLEKLKEVIKNYDNIDFILVGKPLNMDGTEGGIWNFIKDKSEEIEKMSGKNVKFYDERLTSWEAQKLFGGKLARENKKKLDSVSAALILEGCLRDEKCY